MRFGLVCVTLLRMFRARLATSLLAICSLAAGAQENPKSHLLIHVIDPVTAPIPEAAIQISSTASTATQAKTDAYGYADVSIDPGEYRLIVSAPGFAISRQNIAVSGSHSQPIEIRLNIGAISGPNIVAPVNLSTEPLIIEASIPVEPVEMLPIRPRRLRKKHFML